MAGAGRGARALAYVVWLCVVNATGLAGQRPIDPAPARADEPDWRVVTTARAWCRSMDGQLPPTVHLDPRLSGHVRRMLSRSSRFRAQCRGLAVRPWVSVRVRLTHDDLLKNVAAQAVIRRDGAGYVVASVDLKWRVDWSEWLAHEFEHVLEQADGGSMRAFKIASGTWESNENAFETSRAIAAGRDVRVEVNHDRVTTHE